MVIHIVPRRSVSIEAWNATEDDLLKVETSGGQRYYLRAHASHFGGAAKIWFDPEFVPAAVKEFAKRVVRADIEWRSREHHGFSLGPVTHQPADDEVASELDWSAYTFDVVDYDLPLTVRFIYALTEEQIWDGSDAVWYIAWITRDQARKEQATPTPPVASPY